MKGYFHWGANHQEYCKLEEEPPIGLILCSEKNREQIELLQLDRGEIGPTTRIYALYMDEIV